MQVDGAFGQDKFGQVKNEILLAENFQTRFFGSKPAKAIFLKWLHNLHPILCHEKVGPGALHKNADSEVRAPGNYSENIRG
jgi:hypothetical protein